GDPGGHSPFAKALLARLEAHPKELLRNVIFDTYSDVYEASNHAQAPEVTASGAAHTICLDENGCGEGGAKPPVAGPGAVGDAMIDEARSLLVKLGYPVAGRGGKDPAMADAITRFEASVGLPQDGQVSASLLAVLRASTRVASLPKQPGTGEV